MPAATKARIVDASSILFRRNGYAGTGLKQIVAMADAPFGSIYHFFPGGKAQLGEEVIRRSGQYYLELVASVIDSTDDVAAGMEAAFTGAAELLRATDYADACPIAVVALEVASTNDALRQATADVFESWITGHVERFARAGVDPARARELGIEAICALQGAFILSRAMRTTESLDVARGTVVASVRAALADATGTNVRVKKSTRK